MNGWLLGSRGVRVVWEGRLEEADFELDFRGD